MRGKASVAWFSLILLAAATLSPAVAVADEGGPFKIIVREDSLGPSAPNLLLGDAVRWHNVDDRENMTHRIVWDADGDGLYNGTYDWDSGPLTSSCATDENGTTDPDCNVIYEIHFDGTWGAGTYHYCDILSDGTVLEGKITISSETHDDNHNSTDEGNSDPTSNEEEGSLSGEQAQGEGDEQNWLLLVAIFSGLGAVILLLTLITGKDDSLQEEQVPADSDIESIAEEE